jgi:hypothetical protein
MLDDVAAAPERLPDQTEVDAGSVVVGDAVGLASL